MMHFRSVLYQFQNSFQLLLIYYYFIPGKTILELWLVSVPQFFKVLILVQVPVLVPALCFGLELMRPTSLSLCRV